MAIYEKSVRRLIQEDLIADLHLQKGQLVSTDQILTWFGQRYPRIKRGTVTAHLILLSTNAPSRVYHNAKPADDLFYKVDSIGSDSTMRSQILRPFIPVPPSPPEAPLNPNRPPSRSVSLRTRAICVIF